MKPHTKSKLKEKLKRIADIQFGPYTKSEKSGDTKYLLASHFDEFGELTNFKNSYINAEDFNSDELLKENDLILAGKGLRFFAWPYKKEEGNCIASSLFYVIRPKEDVAAEYLAFYLNHPKVQHQLKLLSAGGSIPSLAKRELQNIEIDLPSKKQETEIIALNQLINRETQLIEQLLSHKKKLHREILNRKLNQLKTL